MKHPINISVLNDTVGTAQPTDGIMMMFIKGVAVSGTFALNTAYLLTKLADLVSLGIDAAYVTTNGTAFYQQVSEFYSEAGDGALLWIVGVDISTNFNTFVGTTTHDNLIRYTAQADPANRAKMIGYCYNLPSAGQVASDFPSDVINTLTNLQVAQARLFAQGFQFSAIVDGYNMSESVTPSSIGTMANKACPSVSLCITGTQPNGVSAVGLALGRFARISVGHGFGAVQDGPRPVNNAYLTNSVIIPSTGTLVVGKVYTVFNGAITYNSNTYAVGSKFTAVSGFTTYTTSANGYVAENCTPVINLTPANALGTGDIDYLGAKQFLFLRTWFNHSGFYWNDGATCEDPTKQLSTQEYNRVANALSADALSFFINEIGKNLPVDTATGAIDKTYLLAKQQEFYNTYIKPLKPNEGTGDLSDAKLILTGPNFNSTKTMNFQLEIVPTPILGSVTGIVQFTATL